MLRMLVFEQHVFTQFKEYSCRAAVLQWGKKDPK